jgi:hypothetical protein
MPKQSYTKAIQKRTNSLRKLYKRYLGCDIAITLLWPSSEVGTVVAPEEPEVEPVEEEWEAPERELTLKEKQAKIYIEAYTKHLADEPDSGLGFDAWKKKHGYLHEIPYAR